MSVKELSFIKGIINIFKDFAIWSSKHKASAFLGIMNLSILIMMGIGTMWAYRALSAPLALIKEHSDNENIKDAKEEKLNDLNAGLKDYISQNTVIDKLLTVNLKNQGADRAYLFRFHDSVVGVNGKHFFFMSDTNEVTAKGVSKEMANLQKLPISFLGTWATDMLNHKCVGSWVDSMSDDNIGKEALKAQGIKEIQFCPVFVDNGLIGYIGLDYTVSKSDKFNQSSLNETASEIGDILNKNN